MNPFFFNTLLMVGLFLLANCADKKEKENTSTIPVAVEQQTTEKASTEINKPAIIVDIKKVVGKSLKEVEKVLGKAEGTEKVRPSNTPCKQNPCTKAYFQLNKYEIVFIDGKADWITINDVAYLNFVDSSLELLGLPETKPTSEKPSDMIKWEKVSSIKEINYFSNTFGGIDYIYIKAKTR